MTKKATLIAAVDYRELEERYAALSPDEQIALETKAAVMRAAENQERERTLELARQSPRIITNRKARRAKAAILRKANKRF